MAGNGKKEHKQHQEEGRRWECQRWMNSLSSSAGATDDGNNEWLARRRGRLGEKRRVRLGLHRKAKIDPERVMLIQWLEIQQT